MVLGEFPLTVVDGPVELVPYPVSYSRIVLPPLLGGVKLTTAEIIETLDMVGAAGAEGVRSVVAAGQRRWGAVRPLPRAPARHRPSPRDLCGRVRAAVRGIVAAAADHVRLAGGLTDGD